MIQCPKCQKQLSENAHVCDSCGSPVNLNQQMIVTSGYDGVTVVKNKKSSKRIIITVIAVIVALAIGVGGFFIGKNLSTNNNFSDGKKSDYILENHKDKEISEFDETTAQSSDITNGDKESPTKEDEFVVAPDSTPKSSYDFSSASVGDYINFGSYEQDNNISNGKEEIEWLVLDKQEERILVISKYALDCKPYNTGYGDITWENCTLRVWLNSEFMNEAFTKNEKAKIPMVILMADENPYYSTNPGNNTNDQVFLLSINEADNYFSSNKERECKPTPYAKKQEAYVDSYYGNCLCWWLRTPGNYQYIATGVIADGNISKIGRVVYLKNAVRPAMWINL